MVYIRRADARRVIKVGVDRVDDENVMATMYNLDEKAG
jgi:hypothetical protein